MKQKLAKYIVANEAKHDYVLISLALRFAFERGATLPGKEHLTKVVHIEPPQGVPGVRMCVLATADAVAKTKTEGLRALKMALATGRACVLGPTDLLAIVLGVVADRAGLTAKERVKYAKVLKDTLEIDVSLVSEAQASTILQ